MPHKKRSLADRFWEKVAKTESCWNWTGAINRFGYGKIHIGNRTCAAGAHRASWLINVGPIPVGKHVLHHCDNRACVNPDHLFLGDAAANIRDMVSKGRWVGYDKRGTNNPNAKLTWEQVNEIRQLYLYEEMSISRIAVMYKMDWKSISDIVHNRQWVIQAQ